MPRGHANQRQAKSPARRRRRAGRPQAERPRDLPRPHRRHASFRDHAYGLPADGAFNLGPMHDLIMEVWELDVSALLEQRTIATSPLSALDEALRGYPDTGDLVLPAPDLAD